MRRGCSAPCRGGGCLAAPRGALALASLLVSEGLQLSLVSLVPFAVSPVSASTSSPRNHSAACRQILHCAGMVLTKVAGTSRGNIQGVLVCSYFTLLAAFGHGILTSCSTFSLASLLLSDFSALVVFAWSYPNTSC